MAQEGTLPRDASESDEFTSWEDDLGTVGVVVEPPVEAAAAKGPPTWLQDVTVLGPTL